ncbi:MAG: Eco29kI family restriction endonuclease [Victivallales bacterium]|nr:Eco29kI family restriction endonuclease [Victivallales bacterium]
MDPKIPILEPFNPLDKRNLATRNRQGAFQQPIYVGKAVPAGARKGGFGLGAEPGQALFNRLCDHAKSVDEATNLEKDAFFCRYLAVDDIWIPLAESLMIERFAPLLNLILDGFGNHDPGKGRYNQQKSPWDTLHPGRSWAERLQPNAVGETELYAQVTHYISIHYIP